MRRDRWNLRLCRACPSTGHINRYKNRWEGSSSAKRGNFDWCRIGSVSKVRIEWNRWSLPHNGGSTTHFTFFYLFLGKGCAQRVAHSWWRSDWKEDRHKMCVTWWAVSLHRADWCRMACPADIWKRGQNGLTDHELGVPRRAKGVVYFFLRNSNSVLQLSPVLLKLY